MKPRRAFFRYWLATGAMLVLSLLAADAGWAQLATVNFPDTRVGSSSTVTCPRSGTGLCFGANCGSSGTVQGISGPNPPFALTRLHLVSVSQFTAGTCEVLPVTLPVTVG